MQISMLKKESDVSHKKAMLQRRPSGLNRASIYHYISRYRHAQKPLGVFLCTSFCGLAKHVVVLDLGFSFTRAAESSLSTCLHAFVSWRLSGRRKKKPYEHEMSVVQQWHWRGIVAIQIYTHALNSDIDVHSSDSYLWIDTVAGKPRCLNARARISAWAIDFDLFFFTSQGCIWRSTAGCCYCLDLAAPFSQSEQWSNRCLTFEKLSDLSDQENEREGERRFFRMIEG